MKLYLLKSKLFVLALIILILNDLVLKYQFHNVFTGKLSDFIGLFVFSYFWSTVFPKKAKLVTIITVLFFVFWKSEFSTPFINLINSINLFQIYRIIDYSDIVSICILPFKYLYFENQLKKPAIQGNEILVTFISIVTLFSFCATSMARVPFYSSEKEIDKKFVVPIPHNVVIGKFINLSASEMKFFYPNTDTTLKLKSYIKKYKLNTNFIVNIKAKENGYSEIIIDSIFGNSKYNEVKNPKKYRQIQNLPPTFFEEYFEKNYINEILGCKVKYL